MNNTIKTARLTHGHNIDGVSGFFRTHFVWCNGRKVLPVEKAWKDFGAIVKNLKDDEYVQIVVNN